MKRQISLLTLVALVATASAVSLAATRQVPSGGTTTITGSATGTDGVRHLDLRPTLESDDTGAGSFNRPRPGRKNGKLPKKNLATPVVPTSGVVAPGPEFKLSVLGLNHRDQLLANGGNQLTLEPPDQALCVGNGYVVEAVNSALRVFNTSGAPSTGVQDLNTFFGYPAAFDLSTGLLGPQVIDPVCHYDPDNNRFVVAITTLDVTDGNYNGKNTIDVAVSNTGNPTGTWTIYRVPAQNDGTDGTPDHHCLLNDDGDPGPCFQDYPHIGGDANGIYITTNEFSLFGPGYNAAQIFAFSKAELATHPASIGVTLVENLFVDAQQGFTVWPATSPVGQYSPERNGTEYFLSTIADGCPEAYCTAKRIGLWALTNTASLNSATPALGLTSRTIESQIYVDPPAANQKPGSIPLGDCLNDNAGSFFGDDCWFAFFFDPPPTWQPEVESTPDANDTRMQQTWYVNGTLWGSAGTGVVVNGQLKAGIAWFAISPKINGAGKVEGQIKKQGYLALANNNLTYPAIAVGANGKGVIAFSALGDDYYPSAGYALIDATGSVGPIRIAAAGLGPADGFTSYKAFGLGWIFGRTRWGDYGAALTDGTDVWIASEYIAQTCTLAQLMSEPIGSCGGTRTLGANWATRLTKLTP
jgi:hypothetical protein